MKKNILYTMLFALVALVMTSCGDKKSEGLSRITYYPSIQLKGDSYLVWEKGVAYEEPGYVSELNGEDVTSQVTVSGAVDVNKSGIYTLTYTTVKNSDGFDASASRTISVDDLLGGWYCQRAGYGTKYAMSGVLGVAEDGTLTLIDSYVPGWGDGLDSFEGKFDAATSTINFVCVYAGSLTFTETWVKQ